MATVLGGGAVFVANREKAVELPTSPPGFINSTKDGGS